MLPWIGSSFLASGAAATDETVEEAALPFARRRHRMLIGVGAAGLVVESAAAVRERGIVPICEVLGVVTATSAFHGTRLDAVWKLEDLGNGRTRASYRLDADPGRVLGLIIAGWWRRRRGRSSSTDARGSSGGVWRAAERVCPLMCRRRCVRQRR